MSLKNKKLAKEMASSLVDGMMPMIEAISADKKAEEEKLLFDYFSAKANKNEARVKDVTIVSYLLGKKIEVEYYSDTNGFFLKKFDYDNTMSKVNNKIETDLREFSEVLCRLRVFVVELRKIIDGGQIREDYNLCKTYNSVMETFMKEARAIANLNETKIFTDEDKKFVLEFDEKLKDIAGKFNIKLEEEKVDEASLRVLLKKDIVSINERKFVLAASSYLKDKSEKSNTNYKKFSKLERDEKVKIAYYETLLKKINDYNFSLMRKHMQGEMLNRLIVENEQVENRKEKTLMERVLNGQELEDSEYIDLAFMKINYGNLKVRELTKPYILEDIKERLEVLKRLVEIDSKREDLYSKKMEILNKWRRLIHIFNCVDWNTDSDLYIYMDDIFGINVSDVEDYVETLRSGNPTNKSLDNQRFNYSEYMKMFEKIREFVEGYYEDKEAVRFLLFAKLNRYKEALEKDHMLLDISKKFRQFEIYNGESIFDYEDVVGAYYDYFDESVAPAKGAATNIMLKKFVDGQVGKFEESISSEIRELIKEDKLSVPKKYFKQLEGK